MPRKSPTQIPAKRREEIIAEVIRQLEAGKSMLSICKAEGMPNRWTIETWAKADDDLAAQIRAAREVGFHALAEQALEEARTCADPIKGRLAFDAARWYLGKLSNAFAERPVNVGVQVNVDVDASDAFGAVARALQDAAAARASLAERTRVVVIEGEARPADPDRQLANLADPGGERVG
ncbi:hypothetical protein [Novosphingobium sp.]|uniref:terminase small subunit-like protein n=1 Tax=Novosphingobium sp. TaxID=1874826 RepID=UPI002629CE9C|nr:hypothetical protein [Novosphingobium sp.]